MKRLTNNVALFALTFGLIISIFLLQDWWLMIIIEDHYYIESYHFGSESMMAHGGWAYSNKEFYALSGLFIDIVCISGFLTTLFDFSQRQPIFTALCKLVMCCIYILINCFLNNMKQRLIALFIVMGALSKGITGRVYCF